MYRNDGEISFYLCGDPVKLIQSCLCAGKDRESSFYLCGVPVKLV